MPLWLAINLKIKSKCNIIPPEWLSAGETNFSGVSNWSQPATVSSEYIKQKVDEELGEEQFTVLPFRYLEIAKVLLDVYVDFSTPVSRAEVTVASSLQGSRR